MEVVVVGGGGHTGRSPAALAAAFFCWAFLAAAPQTEASVFGRNGSGSARKRRCLSPSVFSRIAAEAQGKAVARSASPSARSFRAEAELALRSLSNAT